MDEEAWDTLCVDPHASQLEEGRSEGKRLGAASGFREGKNLGLVKGVEYGLELGYIEGFCAELRNNTSVDERVQSIATELSEMIRSFPSPQQMFREKDQSIDVMPLLQRIRTKFKLLQVRAKMKKASLKDVLASGPDGQNTPTSAIEQW